MYAKKNIFVVGLEEFNLHFLQTVRHAEHYEFHCLLSAEEIARDHSFDMPALLTKAEHILGTFGGSVDAIVGYWDFPTTLMLPILRKKLGLRGPTLESVLMCEHKYCSRLEQAKVVPDHVPRFALVDPFDADVSKPPLPFPFWIKPVKAHSSLLGFLVRNEDELEQSLAKIRAGIHRFAEPFNHILSHASLPAECAHVHGGYCIAEELISAGRQCTLEGYVFDGDVEVYGIVDSLRGPNGSSFERYQYPSTLPRRVRHRMIDIATVVMRQLGLDCSPFNMELYYDSASERIFLLEVNARISKSHCPLFEKVEGTSHQEVMIDVALGRVPEYPLGQGQFDIAAKFMLRRYGEYDDSIVVSAPTAEDARALEQRLPGTEIQLPLREGMRLGDLALHDSYSYELAVIFIGADTESELVRRYEEIVASLPFSFRD
jgi:hypothetical protein